VLGLLNDEDDGRGAVPVARWLLTSVGGELRVLSAGPGGSGRILIALILAVDGVLLVREDVDEGRSVAGLILIVGPPKF